MIPIPPGWVMHGLRASGSVAKVYSVVGFDKRGNAWVWSKDDNTAVEWAEMFDAEYTIGEDNLTWHLEYSAVVFRG